MKKFQSFVFAIIFVLGSFLFSSAAMAEGGIPTVMIASQTAEQGSTFDVPVTASDLTDVYGATFNINYDGTLLTYNGFTAVALGGQGTLNVTPGENSVAVEWAADELNPLNIVEDTVLLNLNFSLIPNNTLAADIDFAGGELRDVGGTAIEGVGFISGTVTPLSSLKEITSFSFPEGVGVIDGSDISVTVPFGTDVTALVPTIEFVGQSLEPASGVAQNFTEPQFYTVTSEDLASSGYMVTVTVADPLSNIATLTSGTFTVSAGGTANETITNVPFGTSKTDFLLVLRASETNQTWNDSGIADPVVTGNTLVITAQDGVTVVTYTVTVNTEPVVPAEPVVTGGGGGGFRVRNEEAPSTNNEEVELLSVDVEENSEEVFEPNSYLTRAELVKMVVKFFGIEVLENLGEKPFNDVEIDQSDAVYIAAAKQAGIVVGYADGTFRPDQQVSRVEALKILLEAFGGDLTAEPSSFSDVDHGAWYAKYVDYAKSQGIVEGYPDGTFRPGNALLRGEFAKFMAMVL